MQQILTSSNMGTSLTSFTYNNYLENTKAKSAVCKNIVKQFVFVALLYLNYVITFFQKKVINFHLKG